MRERGGKKSNEHLKCYVNKWLFRIKKMSESRESKKERERDRHRNRYDSNETNESMNIL